MLKTLIRNKSSEFSLNERQKIYLILAFTSLILLFLAIWQVRLVIVESSAPLGPVSYLPVTYWIGFALIIITAVIAVLDKELKKDTIFIIILVILGLFLFGIRVFLYECAQDTDSYYPVSIVYKLLREHHIDITNSPTLVSYYYWPAIHFISASLLTITKVDLLEIMKYTPIFWIPCFVLIIYGIDKQLKLTADHCFLLSILALSSWWLAFSGFYYPRFIAVILFLLILMISLTPKTTVPQSIVIIILSVTLVINHGEIALAVLLGLILLSIYRHNYGLAGFGQVSPASLLGAKYFALTVKPDNYFGIYDSKESLYYDPELINVNTSNPASSSTISLHTANLSLLNNFRYVVISQDYSQSLVLSWGQDPYSIWPQIGIGKISNSIYNNGFFQIFQNNNVGK